MPKYLAKCTTCMGDHYGKTPRDLYGAVEECKYCLQDICAYCKDAWHFDCKEELTEEHKTLMKLAVQILRKGQDETIGSE